ncbi:MAG: bifunctional adenosylcobinamide kinase/adenosylcobinamide-phosphate guanylyltransferase [Lachnospiraceae bacterium]|nr:bifunctional adenosylcobinamide kinase/adenosylcobinamide-phosphate guanylyltransferase [Lachnospiraceae bacterium]
MLNLVIGAAASGKSEYAEDIVMSLPGEKIYIATMEPFGAEAEERIARHRALRAGKGFSTVEWPRNLIGLTPEADWNVLIEDLPNLAANELFSPEGGGAAAVLSGVERICKTASNVTIVTGDIFSDGGTYDTGTQEYMEMLADLHTKIAEKADNVVEVIYGIPCAVKGELPVNIVNYETAASEVANYAEVNVKEMIAQDRLHVYVTGPMASGKREYVLNTLGISASEAAFEVQELLRKEPDMDVAGLVEELSRFQAITQTEVGAGVIPLSASDREWREKAGRLACILAARADIVVRMVCGVPIRVRDLSRI